MSLLVPASQFPHHSAKESLLSEQLMEESSLGSHSLSASCSSRNRVRSPSSPITLRCRGSRRTQPWAAFPMVLGGGQYPHQQPQVTPSWGWTTEQYRVSEAPEGQCCSNFPGTGGQRVLSPSPGSCPESPLTKPREAGGGPCPGPGPRPAALGGQHTEVTAAAWGFGVGCGCWTLPCPVRVGPGSRPGPQFPPLSGHRVARRKGHSHEVGSVAVQDSTEGQAIAERRGHVGDAHVPVALALLPAPFLQRFDGRHVCSGAIGAIPTPARSCSAHSEGWKNTDGRTRGPTDARTRRPAG